MKTLEIKTESGTYLVAELPEGKTRALIGSLNFLFVPDDEVDWHPIYQLVGNWQLIGFGKDHPNLVEELGLLQENPVKPEYTRIEESTMEAVQRYNRQLVEQEQAEKYVFKNPVILKKQ